MPPPLSTGIAARATWPIARPEDVVTGNKADGYKRRPVATAGMKEGVRYQMYASKDGHVLFMASEQAFWKNFCEGVGRTDLFEKWPGSKYADHARGNRELQAVLRDIFRTKTSAKNGWSSASAPTRRSHRSTHPKNIVDDPQFKARFAVCRTSSTVPTCWATRSTSSTSKPCPSHTSAPTVGQHSDEVLRDVLGYDAAKIAAIKTGKLLG
jgi:crotonobetainyl-CoA:carnitine CoA-transferase CaiB-like acyl-CoA transferase